jgi:hypothetical protein
MRTMHEVLNPHLLDQKSAYKNQFEGMTRMPFTYEDYEATREQLIKDVNSSLTDKDRSFLLSFKRGKPEWDLFPIPELKEMPAVQWKLLNIQKLMKSNPEKHMQLMQKLESLLDK